MAQILLETYSNQPWNNKSKTSNKVHPNPVRESWQKSTTIDKSLILYREKLQMNKNKQLLAKHGPDKIWLLLYLQWFSLGLQSSIDKMFPSWDQWVTSELTTFLERYFMPQDLLFQNSYCAKSFNRKLKRYLSLYTSLPTFNRSIFYVSSIGCSSVTLGLVNYNKSNKYRFILPWTKLFLQQWTLPLYITPCLQEISSFSEVSSAHRCQAKKLTIPLCRIWTVL